MFPPKKPPVPGPRTAPKPVAGPPNMAKQKADADALKRRGVAPKKKFDSGEFPAVTE